MPVARLNALASAAARDALRDCCHARRWADAMVAARPFGTVAAVHAAADGVFDGLLEADWHEAFAGHARIGDRAAADAQGRAEQAQAASASADEQAALRAGNAAYEERFGHVFLICASGLDAATMLAALRERIDNDPERELELAAAEQRKITHLRLDRLLA